MWVRAGKYFLALNGKCTSYQRIFTRGFRTQCINFHPRGYRWREEAQTWPREEAQTRLREEAQTRSEEAQARSEEAQTRPREEAQTRPRQEAQTRPREEAQTRLREEAQTKPIEETQTRRNEAQTRSEEAQTRPIEEAQTRSEEAQTRSEETQTRRNEAQTRRNEAQTRRNEAQTRRSEEAQTRPREDTDEGNVCEVEAGRHTHRQDTRPIDTMDPVVLKYTNIINEMRSKSSGVERVNITHFGSIRFDDENVPHTHGLFDLQEGPEVKPARCNDTSHLDIKLNCNQGKFEVLKKEHQQDLNSNYVDSNLPNQAVHNVLNGDEVRNQGSVTRSDNYIDESIFGDSLFTSLNMTKSPPIDGMQRMNVESEIGDKENTNLGYIDEVFFKSSLENIQMNREPVIGYSDIKKEVESAVLSGQQQVTSEESDKEILDVTKGSVEKGSKDKVKIKQKVDKSEENETPKSAYEYVVKVRREEHKKQHGVGQVTGDGSNKSYKKVLSLVNEQTKDRHTRHEVLKVLKSSILYNDHDIVGLHKPYGIAMHGGSNSQYHILTEYLPELADFLKAEALYPVHRLDAATTGVVLLARTAAMADTLKRLFKERQLKKTYWAITKGIPQPVQGIIDIPVAEGLVDGRRRMVLKPDVPGIKSTTSSSKLAITRFQVVSKRESAALVKLSPMTGVKHQLRVHLAFGLSCPVLGDHKYSHLKKMAPQVLPGDMLDKLKIKQSKVRNLPVFLHCKSILVPEIVDGRNIFIAAKIPAYFNKTLSLLKLNRYESKVRIDGLGPVMHDEVAPSHRAKAKLG